MGAENPSAPGDRKTPEQPDPAPKTAPGSAGPSGGKDSLPKSALRRGARLASLPLGMAGRATAGLGRRLGGASAETVNEQMQQRAADQLFRVLGDLKGGAMKVGQAMSLFESMLPDEVAGPYREKLSMLRDSAPSMPASRVHAVLSRELGEDWRDNFAEFDPRPAAAASIGQVHHAVWKPDREVAVKVQYPGADEALRSDLRQMSRLAQMAGSVVQGIDLKALAGELADRIDEELDYELEAQSQQQFADGLAGSTEFCVPPVVANTSRVLVTDWIDGVPLAQVGDWPEPDRSRTGLQYVRFLFAGPSTVGLLHGDPHPGNFLVMPDGRLGVVDFGLVSRLPEGLPTEIGHTLRIAMSGDARTTIAALREEGILTRDVDAELVLDYLSPFVEPAGVAEFHFDRDWMQEQFRRANSDSAAAQEFAKAFNLPASYLLLHRVWLGGIAVLCQLDITANFSQVLEEFLPGFAQDAP